MKITFRWLPGPAGAQPPPRAKRLGRRQSLAASCQARLKVWEHEGGALAKNPADA